MKNLKVFAVAAMMLAALVSCKKNDSPAEPEPKPPVELVCGYGDRGDLSCLPGGCHLGRPA